MVFQNGETKETTQRNPNLNGPSRTMAIRQLVISRNVVVFFRFSFAFHSIVAVVVVVVFFFSLAAFDEN